MSDEDLPDLPKIPSFEELGISAEELAELEKELDEAEASGEAGDTDAAESLDPALLGGITETAAAGSTGSAVAGATGKAAESQPGIPGPEKTRKERRAEEKARKQAKRVEKTGQRDQKTEQPDQKAEQQTQTEGQQTKKAAPSAKATRTPLGPAPLGGMRGPATFLFLAIATWFLSSFRTTPSPVPANAPADEFSSARAMTHLVEIARAAHPPGSPEHTRVRGYLLDALTDLGMTPSVQTATAVSGTGPFVRTATVRNIVARKAGTASAGAILLTAHYDGREVARAAGDDGVGVVSILEALRALNAGPAVQNDIMVLFTDAEELGLLGARAFVDEHPWLDDVSVVLSFEMRGGGGPAVMFETGAENGWIVRALKAADPAPSANALMYEVYQSMPNDTDFTPFREAGKQGLNFAAIGRAPVYHQQYDSPENVSEATLQHQGVHALGLIQHLGNAELSSVIDDDVSYLSVPVLGLVTYSPWWAYLLSGLILLLYAGAGWFARKRGASVGGMVAGFVGTVLVGGLVAGAAVGLLRWLPRFHPEAGQLHGSFLHSEGWYVLVLGFATVAFALAVFGLLRRWFAIPALAIGAAAIPALFGIVAGFALPVGAMNIQWPVLAAIVATLIASGTKQSDRLATARWILLCLVAIPVLAVLVPLIELLWLAMSFSMAPAIGLLCTMLVVLVLPLFDVTREPNGWWAPVTSLAVGGACLGIGILAAAADSDRPAPSTLIYTYDRESGAARWATDPDSVYGGSAAAREWVTAAIGPVGEPVPLGPFMWRRTGRAEGPMYATAAAPPSTAPLPTARLVVDPTAPPGRARVVFRSEIGAELMAIDLDAADAALVAVNGSTLSLESPAEFVEHWGVPEGDVVLDFDASGTPTPFRFAVIETHFRPNELVEGDPFDRPPELAPNIRRLSDRAMIRTPVVIDPAAGTVTIAGVVSSGPASADSILPVVTTPADTLEADTLVADSLVADSLVADTVGIDSPAIDSIAVDSVAVDTVMAADTAGTPTSE